MLLKLRLLAIPLMVGMANPLIRSQATIFKESNLATTAVQDWRDQVTPVSVTSHCFWFVSEHLPDYQIGLKSDGPELFMSRTTNETFKIRPPLNDKYGFISFESCFSPGKYLRHKDNTIKLEAKEGTSSFKEDATWKVLPGLIGDDTYTFESANSPNMILRHHKTDLGLDSKKKQDMFKKDASFVLKKAKEADPKCQWVLSENVPGYHIGTDTSDWNAFIVNDSKQTYRVGTRFFGNDTAYVSLESCLHRGKFLRHKNSFIYLDAKEDSEQFKKDATWKIASGFIGDNTVSIESANLPSRVIRHWAQYLILDAETEQSTWPKQASFKLIEAIPGIPRASALYKRDVCHKIQSVNLPSYKVAVHDTANHVYIMEKLLTTFKFSQPLNGKSGMISFELCDIPGYYLYQKGDYVAVAAYKDKANDDKFKKSASWNPMPGLAGGNSLTFQSGLDPNSYIRHLENALRVNELADDDAFGQDASFVLKEAAEG